MQFVDDDMEMDDVNVHDTIKEQRATLNVNKEDQGYNEPIQFDFNQQSMSA